jgi:hypothetical protein
MREILVAAECWYLVFPEMTKKGSRTMKKLNNFHHLQQISIYV